LSGAFAPPMVEKGVHESPPANLYLAPGVIKCNIALAGIMEQI
jgi:hypothetical protein